VKHLDLFSGIGGFALAADWVWGAEHEIVSFCEIESFCQKVLKKHWPDVPIHDDIKTLKGDKYGTIDLITGGFPCQSFSVAGKRRGKNDDRYLWPEMFRIIQEARPRWVIGENVTGIINMALDEVLSDLESEGYEAQTFIIPACSQNAPHRRDRVWIVANSKLPGSQERWPQNNGKMDDCTGKRETSGYISTTIKKSNSYAPNSTNAGLKSLRQERENSVFQDANASDTKRTGLEGGNTEGTGISDGWDTKHFVGNIRQNKNESWDEPWFEVATRLCSVDDGLLPGLDGRGMTRNKYRVNKLKALGNAIVPQVVVPIMESIKKIDEEMK